MPDEREFGRLEATVHDLAQRIEKLEPKIDSLLRYIERQKGGWAVVLMVAAVASAVGAAVTKVGTWFAR